MKAEDLLGDLLVDAILRAPGDELVRTSASSSGIFLDIALRNLSTSPQVNPASWTAIMQHLVLIDDDAVRFAQQRLQHRDADT